MHTSDKISFFPLQHLPQCGLSPLLVLSGVILFSLNKRLHKPFAPVALITFAILLSAFLLNKGHAAISSSANQEISRSKQMVLSSFHRHTHFESLSVTFLLDRASQTHAWFKVVWRSNVFGPSHYHCGSESIRWAASLTFSRKELVHIFCINQNLAGNNASNHTVSPHWSPNKCAGRYSRNSNKRKKKHLPDCKHHNHSKEIDALKLEYRIIEW